MEQNCLREVSIKCLKEIHEDSSTPFVIFNEHCLALSANKSFLKQFNLNNETNIEGKRIDFIYEKNENDLIPFSQLPIEGIINNYHIYSYFTESKEEYFFYVSTFCIGATEHDKFYYSILREITDIEEKLMEDSIRALVIASQLKDNDTGNHVKRVNAYSYALAKCLYETRGKDYPEVDVDFISKIFKVSSMHDVGKIGTPDYILTKPGRLTEEEFKIMKEHTINGAFILSKLAGHMARDIALFHHEKWDGSGYPYQLREEQIPLAARIVAISDVYDALRMERHYKRKYTHEETRQVIVEGRETHFDPVLVNCFLEIEDAFYDIFDKMRDMKDNKIFYIDSI